MSFGVGIGDFKAVAEVVKKVIDRVKDSPDQIKNTRQDIEAVSAFIKREDTSRLNGVTDPLDRARIHETLAFCERIVQGVQSELSRFKDVQSGGEGLWMMLKQLVYVLSNVFDQRLKWDQKENADTRIRVLTSLALLEGEFRRLDSEILRHTHAVVKDTQAGVERLHKREDLKEMDAERQAILNWICPSEIDYTDQQYDLTRKRQPGIGQWFLDSQDFQNWLHGSDTILMGIGMPGVGKSMITSLVVSHVLEKYKDDSGIGLAYIYCQFARHQEQTPEYLMSSILRQLVGRQSIIPDIVKSLYRSARGNRCPRPDEMSDLLEAVISSLTRSIIVVDALDELTSHNRVRDKFVSKLLAICRKFEVKIFMTSRVPIKGASGTRSSTERAICALEDDMRRSIRIKFEDGNLFCGKVDLQEKVTSGKILRAANEVYLIAMLYAEHLSLFEEPGELLDALDEIDHTSDPYKTVYEQTIRRITSDNNPKNKRNLALTILCYSFLAKRVITRFSCQSRVD
ncbi:hypothetical protein D6D15_00923 [Aureobasidium pullulans]|uniref:Nephrocystin 3-like N-terminal domain-containing protein n=1 Tax=Aureobasidium pullulans TaxID=5580 RepID=A0A4S9BRW3_AURPU|nr:hypothetical protein D6D15_00923 [Aureobasidium pullulans]